MNPDRQATIAARAHQLWEEAGHPHEQDAQHWRQAEREHDEAEARVAAAVQFKAAPLEAAPAKATRRCVALAVEVASDVPSPPVRKARAPRKASAPAPDEHQAIN